MRIAMPWRMGSITSLCRRRQGRRVAREAGGSQLIRQHAFPLRRRAVCERDARNTGIPATLPRPPSRRSLVEPSWTPVPPVHPIICQRRSNDRIQQHNDGCHILMHGSDASKMDRPAALACIDRSLFAFSVSSRSSTFSTPPRASNAACGHLREAARRRTNHGRV